MSSELDFIVGEGVDDTDIPSEADFKTWVSAAAVAAGRASVSLSVKIVSTDESQQLNLDYRDKDKPTNVLSFPSDIPDFIDDTAVGDLAICADVVAVEAKTQQKPVVAHWAHMVVHGTLHLLGYDHIEDEDAQAMESLEITILQALGYADPYHVE